MSTPLAADEIQTALRSLLGWTQAGNTVTKTFTFGSFREAFSFMVRVGFEAEAMNHHPDWTNLYNRVEIRLSTHDAGDKVTGKDIALAQQIEKINWA